MVDVSIDELQAADNRKAFLRTEEKEGTSLLDDHLSSLIRGAGSCASSGALHGDHAVSAVVVLL